MVHERRSSKAIAELISTRGGLATKLKFGGAAARRGCQCCFKGFTQCNLHEESDTAASTVASFFREAQADLDRGFSESESE